MLDVEDVKRAARGYGADLIGIAPVARLSHLPAEENPLSIFPQCKSVIVLARRILRGSLRGVEEGTNFGSTYQAFGFNMLEDNFLAQTTYDLTCFLESNAAEAVPLFAYEKSAVSFAVPVAPGKPAPNVFVDYRACAQAAGLGEYGLGGFFLTPEFGPRQRFALILTDAELAPDAVRSVGALCRDCSGCVEACPLGAIDVEHQIEVGIPGSRRSVATVDREVCRQCKNGALQLPGRNEAVDRFASACGRRCVVELEKRGALTRNFQNAFRQSPAWTRDALGRVKVEEI